MRRTAFPTLILFLTAMGCSAIRPDAGEEAVLIRKPFFFSHGGVGAQPVASGLKWVAWTTHSVIVDMKPTQFSVHFDDLMSQDGVPLDFDSVIRLQVTDSVELIRRFGPKWYETNVGAELMNRVRQEVRKHGMNETAIDSKAIDAIDAAVSAQMESYLQDAKLPIRLIGFTVGKANPPDLVKDQRIHTAREEQRIQTEGQTRLAEDARREAENSRAVADNAYRNALGLSGEQFIRLEQIKMQREVCVHGGCTFLLGAQAIPSIPLGSAAEPRGKK